MKESLVGVVLTGLLALAVLGVAAAYPGYESGQPRPSWAVVKRAYWDRPAPLLDDPDAPGQPEALQVLEKRGFGSMMPAYLLQLYRPDQPLINPSFSSPVPLRAAAGAPTATKDEPRIPPSLSSAHLSPPIPAATR